jgi:2-polyprenyl-6-hydroxyphenyl methylase/3-demethylubiquinone-9 3-methyltransferase
MITPATAPSLDTLIELGRSHGGTDVSYLAHHYPRFAATKREFESTWDRKRGLRVLDVGAHWLHQSLLYALDGYQVTATDLPLTMDLPNVRSLADAHGIRLLSTPDLARADALAALPEDGFDVILFTEIIEHITFNPVALWKSLYRLAAPGARIIVTTPNYYALRGRAWDFRRFATGFGGGLDVLSLLNQHTYAHHWKEFSRRELIYYFCVLSPDFNTVKARYLPEFHPDYLATPGRWLGKRLEQALPFLRPNLHIEVELVAKQHGIRVEPSW